jgi:hypothetical protein
MTSDATNKTRLTNGAAPALRALLAGLGSRPRRADPSVEAGCAGARLQPRVGWSWTEPLDEPPTEPRLMKQLRDQSRTAHGRSSILGGSSGASAPGAAKALVSDHRSPPSRSPSRDTCGTARLPLVAETLILLMQVRERIRAHVGNTKRMASHEAPQDSLPLVPESWPLALQPLRRNRHPP